MSAENQTPNRWRGGTVHYPSDDCNCWMCVFPIGGRAGEPQENDERRICADCNGIGCLVCDKRGIIGFPKDVPKP